MILGMAKSLFRPDRKLHLHIGDATKLKGRRDIKFKSPILLIGKVSVTMYRRFTMSNVPDHRRASNWAVPKKVMVSGGQPLTKLKTTVQSQVVLGL